MTLRTVLLSLQALLAAAEPDDPQDAVVAKQFKENQDMFRQTARHWTFIYAGGTQVHSFIKNSFKFFLNLLSFRYFNLVHSYSSCKHSSFLVTTTYEIKNMLLVPFPVQSTLNWDSETCIQCIFVPYINV